MPIHVVIAGGILFAAYHDARIANAHALTISGAVVVAIELLDRLPPEVRDDISHDFWDEEQETPVIGVEELDDGDVDEGVGER